MKLPESWERSSPLPLFVENAAKDCRAPIAETWVLRFVSGLARPPPRNLDASAWLTPPRMAVGLHSSIIKER